jgi:hypothetical protein
MPDFFDSIDTKNLTFRTSEAFISELSADWQSEEGLFTRTKIGASEEGRAIHAFTAGRGDKKVALLGGAHSDEPVGPEMLRLLVNSFLKDEHEQQARPLLEEYTFIILPHINPDGEAENWKWINEWPDMASYAAHAFREKPGRDLEFGYPDMRQENSAVADFLRSHAPFHLYINFHGMAVAEGVMLLIERHWIEQSRPLQHDFIAMAEAYGLPLHDHDRAGDKGFQYIGPGFTTTPEGRAMQQYFKEKGDKDTASKFHLSSMEFIRSLGGDSLCLVTELPLYIVSLKEEVDQKPGVPQAYLKFKEQLPDLRKRAADGESLQGLLEPFEIHALSLKTQVDIQLSVIENALELLS